MQLFVSSFDPFKPARMRIPARALKTLAQGAPWIGGDSHVLLWDGSHVVVRDDGTVVNTYPDHRPNS